MAYIEWIDHHGCDDDRWRTKSELIEMSEDNMVIRTWGVVIYEDEEKLIIASEERIDKDLVAPIYRKTVTVMKKLITGQG